MYPHEYHTRNRSTSQMYVNFMIGSAPSKSPYLRSLLHALQFLHDFALQLQASPRRFFFTAHRNRKTIPMAIRRKRMVQNPSGKTKKNTPLIHDEGNDPGDRTHPKRRKPGHLPRAGLLPDREHRRKTGHVEQDEHHERVG